MKIDGTDQVNLTQNAADDYSGVPSLDNLNLAFLSTRDGNTNIYVMQLKSDKLRQITIHQAAAFSPIWLQEK